MAQAARVRRPSATDESGESGESGESDDSIYMEENPCIHRRNDSIRPVMGSNLAA